MKLNNVVTVGGLVVLLSIVLGAFAAHGLKTQLGASAEQIAIFKTGVEYQLYHGFAIIIAALCAKQFNYTIKYEIILWLLGICFFSFSLYTLCVTSIKGIEAKFLGPMTPIGGFFFIIGWAIFLVNVKKSTRRGEN